MKICITTGGIDLDAPIDSVFGRARYFLLVDSDTLEVEAIENTPSAHGAGVQAAQTMVDQGVDVVLTGNVGPNAFQGLTAAGVRTYVGAVGTAADALAAHKAGTLQAAGAPTKKGHGGRVR